MNDGSKPTTGSDVILTVENVKKYFPIRRGVFKRVVGWVKAVDDVSFQVRRGETLGLVGESGCGKTTLGRTILRLYEPTAGKIMFEGRNLADVSGGEMRRIRRDLQTIFQDPFSSLNPRMPVGKIIGEPLKIHGIAGREERREIVDALMERVGLNPVFASRFPHEFSGGPAPAHRHRPRAGAQPEVHRRRRAGLGARRVDPGAGGQPARGPPA